MVYLLALAAALSNALTSVSSAWAWRTRRPGTRLRLRLMTHAVRRGIWLAGFGLMTLSFVMQAIALHFGRLTEVQPIITMELLFLVLILVRGSGSRSVGGSGSGPARPRPGWPVSSSSPTPWVVPRPRAGRMG